MADENEQPEKDEAGGAEAPEGTEGEGAEEGEGGAAPSKAKKWIIIGALVVVLAAVPAALYFTGVIGPHKENPNVPVDENGNPMVDKDGKPLPPQQIIYYDLDEFIVNLNVGSKRPSFLKMTVSLELPGEATIPAIEAKLPRIRDSFQVYLRELRLDDLQGSAGIYRLREELLLRINKIVYPAKVNDILFKQILVQ